MRKNMGVTRASIAAFLVLALAQTALASPEETAAALSQLVINTRSAVAKHFTQPNKIWWLPDALYRLILARNAVLPAAVVGSAIHPLNDDGVVVLKMAVREPRNEKNKPDAVETELLAEVLRTGQPASRSTAQHAYHARPIKAVAWCMRCHGLPKGGRDPIFPKFRKEGWSEGEVIGAATARVKR
jgi:hypothetical protein